MEDLKEQGFMKNLYEIYCMDCSKSKGIFLEKMVDFDDDCTCDFCNKNLSNPDDAIVLYKVIRV